MASKSGLAGGLPERRVRPIWDAVDSRQFKIALKHSATLLSKYPNSPYALALKALILERMGKPDEALAVILLAKEFLFKNESALMDELTLSTLQSVFQRLDRLELATSCYEHACGKFPNNIELLIGLFNSYVRVYSFVKQQQTAIKMYKLVGEERFLLWAVCSILLQVFCGDGRVNLLPLAEGLIKKHISSHSLHDPESLHVYMLILERQSKYGDCLEVISGNLGSLLAINADKLRIQAKLLVHLGDYATAADVYQEVLIQCPDDWECFQMYLNCLLVDPSNKEAFTSSDPPDTRFLLKDDAFNSRVSLALKLVQKLQADSNNDSCRSTQLCLLEIARRKILCGIEAEDDVIDYLLRYYKKFGHLTCFVSDIEMFANILSMDKKILLLNQIRDISTSPLGAESSEALRLKISFFKMQELVMRQGGKTSVSELNVSAVQMMELFCKNLKLSKDFDPQESVLGEDLLTIVSNALVEMYMKTKRLGYCFEAILVLEFGLTIRRHVWQYKILLLHLYLHLGSLTSAYDCYKSLEVKNILMETTMHNILLEMLFSPLWKDQSDLLKDYIKFMDDHVKESAELTFLAYRHKNYSKAIEFVLFREKLQNSNQLVFLKAEASFLQIKQKADNIAEEEGVLESINYGTQLVKLSDEIRSKKLSFNEDLSIRPWWTPNPLRNFLSGSVEEVTVNPKEILIKEMEEYVRGHIEIKCLLPRMIYLSIQSAATAFKDHSESNGSAVDAEISSEFKVLLERYANLLGYSFDDASKLVDDINVGEKSPQDFGLQVVEWANLAVFLNALKLNESGNKLWKTVDNILEKCIAEESSNIGDLLQYPRSNLSVLVRLVTEPLAWHCLVIQSCLRSSLPSGKRKKKGGSFLPLDDVRESIASLHGTVERLINQINELLRTTEDESVDAILSSVTKTEEADSPGHVLSIIHSNIGDLALCHQSLNSWNSAHFARKISSSSSQLLRHFLHICDLKLATLLAFGLH